MKNVSPQTQNIITPLARAEKLLTELSALEPAPLLGRVEQAIGTLVESSGPEAALGDLCRIKTPDGRQLNAEVVGFRGKRLLLMPLQKVEGLRSGSSVEVAHRGLTFPFSEALMGRVIDGLGRPLDDLHSIHDGTPIGYDNEAPSALSRPAIDRPFLTGVRVLDSLLSLGVGQRIGVFAGSGVGKSTLMGMLARGSQADVNVIGLIGERGREVGDFIREQLGPEGLARSVVVAATSDRSPMERIKGAMLATSIAEAFRDLGKDVCLMMDSVTRVAMAQREVGLAVGEPPASRGYTPSVFALLPRLLERTGPAPGGCITSIYTVLVEGDDMNDPIADTVRGILDGHVVLSRELAHRNHFPAVDVLGSVSRVMPSIVGEEQMELARVFRELLADLKEARELMALGGYQPGNSHGLDLALHLENKILGFLRQREPHLISQQELLEIWRKVVEPNDET